MNIHLLFSHQSLKEELKILKKRLNEFEKRMPSGRRGNRHGSSQDSLPAPLSLSLVPPRKKPRRKIR